MLKLVPYKNPTFKFMLEFDDYLPITFDTTDRAIDASFVRLGNFSTSLLELKFAPESGILRGFTVVCFNMSHKPNFSPAPVPSPGLVSRPQLKESGKPQKSEDLKKDFSIGIEDKTLEILIGATASPDQTLTFGRVQFLLAGEHLHSIRILDLSSTELASISYFIEQAVKHIEA